jgi:hypothetical protein
LQKSFFLNIERSNTIHPHEIDRAGNAAVNAASIGGIFENFKGPKNIIKVINRRRNKVTLSNIVEGGDKNIFAISI